MKPHSLQNGFTLVELLLSIALIALLVAILASMTNATAFSWRYTSAKIEQFRGAETAFETISRRLSQATLNTSWDYQYPNGNTASPPSKYVRQSDLRFIAGPTQTLMASTTPPRPTHGIFFQAPLGYVDDTTNFGGMDNLLNTWGYYLEYNQEVRPPFINTLPHAPALRSRFRLMEFMQPSNKLTIYSLTSGNSSYAGHEWFTNAFNDPTPPVHVLAENVIALVLLPKLSPSEDPTGAQLSPTYAYDSTTDNSSSSPSLNPKNQLPPIVQVTLVAIDEASAARMSDADTANLTAELGGLFTDATQYDTNLKLTSGVTSGPPSLANYLISHKINYRIFTTNVSLRGAKWSRN
jgi:uncharacterized protein (TIGR02599 family)